MITLLQSWRDSLRLLELQNLKSFTLVTIKTSLDMYRTINRPFTSRGNWVLVLIIGVLIVLTNSAKMRHLFWLSALISNVILHALVFVFCLAMRPSVELKNLSYFSFYIKRFWLLGIITIALGVSNIYGIPFVFIFYLFFLLFVLDSHRTIRDLILSARNGFLMMVTNLPISILLECVLRIINFILFYLVATTFEFGGLTSATVLYIIFVPVEIALITNLYIKFVHSQSSLYFPQPK